ncbi:hypothetical protein KA005_65210 [bacterium]|nr:hypothetical protein [bacterium]
MTELAMLIEEMKLKRDHNQAMLISNKNIEKLLDKLLFKNDAVNERYIVNGYTIVKSDHYEVPPVSSPEFERARIFCSVGFNENTTAGIAIDLYYAGHRIGEVLQVSPTQPGMSAGSEAFDINRLSGFNLVIRNKDVSQSVKINTLKIVLYNE